VANAGLIPAATAVLGLALFHGGIAQMIAGGWEFANGNTFGATDFVSFGGFWLAFWFIQSTGGAETAGAKGGRHAPNHSESAINDRQGCAPLLIMGSKTSCRITAAAPARRHRPE